ncbi:MAG TPA: formate dehydrogenase accessory sulfurtransferase FdhD [Rhizomicrobium sp.]|nr:formate dehydrogenase accessory sulfurtransferase FdhD [Rhizomicrobium sp.]
MPLFEAQCTARVAGASQSDVRLVPEETAVAFVYDGVSEAVMMATPQDLDDFGFGFSLTEGIIGQTSDVCSLKIVSFASGIELRMELVEAQRERASKRRRQRAGPAGCGLCGIESLAQAMRAVPPITTNFTVKSEEVVESMRLLNEAQSLNRRTHAIHAAGFYRPDMGAIIVREDVGRHNAVDKVAGVLGRAGGGTDGLLLLTSRISVELVQKAAMMGAPVLAAISAPTALALRLAQDVGICVIGVVRGTEMEIFTHPERVRPP